MNDLQDIGVAAPFRHLISEDKVIMGPCSAFKSIPSATKSRLQKHSRTPFGTEVQRRTCSQARELKMCPAAYAKFSPVQVQKLHQQESESTVVKKKQGAKKITQRQGQQLRTTAKRSIFMADYGTQKL